MVCEKPVEQSNGVDSGLVLPNSAEQAMAAPENGNHSASATSTQSAVSSSKGETAHVSAAGQDVYNPPSSYYNYYYPGYNGTFGQSNDGRDHTSMGAQADHNSIAYYMPGYNPYAAGTFVGADGHCVSQPYYTSSGYLQTPVTYGAEALPCYTWDPNSPGNHSNGSNTVPETVNSSVPHARPARSNGIKPSKLYNFANSNISAIASKPKSHPSVAASNVSQPKFYTQAFKPLNKSGTYYQPDGFANVYRPAGNNQTSSFQRRNMFGNNGAMSFRPNVRTWNVNDKFRPNGKGGFEMSAEVTCGPRGHKRSDSDSSEKEPQVSCLTVKKDKYNMAEFQTEYESAKFYVIKSYSEDDVHKCLKYDVWSSTANGNKKLDAAFHDAEVKSNETGTKCPIFLFFSVNGSGQFVGVAEMIGKVDFNKTMDFWQLDKWSGFFPVQWHLVKDIPNTQLRHIVLESNENRPVTYTRDTQEIGLKQGLEMLKIFKNYVPKTSPQTSLLDDFDFYENREKALLTKRSSKSGAHQTEVFANGDLSKQSKTEATSGEGLSKSQNSSVTSVAALVNLTDNLSLDSNPKIAL